MALPPPTHNKGSGFPSAPQLGHLHTENVRVMILMLSSPSNPTASAEDPSEKRSSKWMIYLYLRLFDL